MESILYTFYHLHLSVMTRQSRRPTAANIQEREH
jgi:hypothetical protein